jgi:hypothetical protein
MLSGLRQQSMQDYFLTLIYFNSLVLYYNNKSSNKRHRLDFYFLFDLILIYVVLFCLFYEMKFCLILTNIISF